MKKKSINIPKAIKALKKSMPILIRWLASNQQVGYKDTSYSLRVVDKILNVLESRGISETIRYTKDLRLKFLKVIFDMTPETFERGEKLWLPKILMPIVRHIQERKSYPFIRLIFSALYITRSLRLDSEISLDTILKGPSYTGNPSSMHTEIKLFLKDLGVNLTHIGKVPKSLRFKEFHMTSKSGPNGHALWSSFKDIQALSSQQKEAIKETGGEKLYDLMDKFSGLYKRIPQFFDSRIRRKAEPITRKLVKILDKEGKVREVAIGDYYTQAALLPLHKFLLKLLSNINQDCTLNQTKLFYSIDKSIGSSYHSIDLTAFTDRFPIDLIYEIILIWFGEVYAKSWKFLMVGTPFLYGSFPVHYNTGNPMGLYSSWVTTTLAHHFLVWLACKRVNLNWRRSRYMLLGDDIVICNDNLAKAYKDILLEWGIEFNSTKTHTSPHGFEFAKQIRLHGENVSPFPLSALFERRTETITSLGIILSEIQQKKWNFDLKSAVKSYYLNVFRWSRPRFRAFEPIINLVISLLRYLQGEEILGKAIRSYVKDALAVKPLKWDKKVDPKAAVHKRLFTHWVAVQVVQTLYLESRERIVSPTTPGSLGDLATEMVCHITSLRDGGMDCFDLIEAVPFLQVYGRAEEIYLKSYDALYDFGMGSSQTDLRKHIGKVDIPLSDDGFYTRHRDVLIVQAMRASKTITKLLSTTTHVDAYNGQLKFDLPWRKALEEKLKNKKPRN